MSPLDPKEQVNLNTFSDDFAVKHVYDKQGLTELESMIVEKHFTIKGRVLDIGCGTGRTTVHLAKMGFDVIGIDLSAKMIEFAQKKHKHVDFRVMNACNLNFSNESFDYAFFSFNGMDYIYPYDKRLNCLAEINRVLKIGGCLIYSSHNALCLPRHKPVQKVFLKNLKNLQIFTKYRLEDSETGELHTYYGSPFTEQSDLRRCGFAYQECLGRRFRHIVMISLFDLSPYYVAKKIKSL